MKVKVTLEADVDDLPPFYPKGDEGEIIAAGAARQNVFDVVRGMTFTVLESRMLNRMDQKSDALLKEAVERALQYKLSLTHRLVDKMTIQFEE